MPILAAEREREARRIGKARRRAVNHFRDHRQRLQRARSDILEQQQRREIAQLPIVRHREHGAEPRQVDVLRAHVVMGRHAHLHHFGQACAADCRWQSPAARPAPASRVRRRDSE